MSEARTPIEGTPRQRMPTEEAEITPGTRVRWPLIGIIAGAVALGGIAFAGSLRYYRLEAAATATQTAIDDGGIVSKRTLRTVLREMQILCTPSPAGGMACEVKIPKEAD